MVAVLRSGSDSGEPAVRSNLWFAGSGLFQLLLHVRFSGWEESCC